MSYHITYPTASTDRSSDYTNEANAPTPNTFSPFPDFSRAVGVTSPFLFPLRALGQHEALEDNKKAYGVWKYNVYIPREGKMKKGP